MSFLEMLDVVNEGLITQGEEPIAFDHDCREGICGQCGVVINGDPHGPRRATTTCQLHMRSFQRRRRPDDRAVAVGGLPGRQGPDGRPRRLRPDHRRRAGSSRSARATPPTANAIPVPKDDADLAMDAAACIGCGACVAACPNASAMLFVGGQGLAPQPAAAGPARAEPSRRRDGRRRWTPRASAVATNHGECEAACPKEIRLEFISRLNRDYFKAALFSRKKKAGCGFLGRLNRVGHGGRTPGASPSSAPPDCSQTARSVRAGRCPRGGDRPLR